MRIGLFSDTYPPEINGVANSTYILRCALENMGHDVYVITTNSEGKTSSHWEDDGKTLRFKGAELKFLYGYVMTSPFHFKALQEIKKLDLDIIHDQTEFGVGIFAHICASQLNIPLVSTYHTTYEDYTHYVNFINSKRIDSYAKKMVARLSKLYGNRSVMVIAPSKKTKDMLESYNIRRDINIIPTGLMLDKFKPSEKTEAARIETRKQYGFDDDTTVIVSIGRIAEEKSVDVVISCMKEVKDAGIKAKLLLVGSGPDFDKIQKLCDKLGLHDDVIMTGAVPSENVPDLYRAGDVFISASVTETQGMTFIEALASGIPVLARYDDVLSKLVENDVTGWFYEDPADFTEKLKKYISLSTAEKDALKQDCLKRVEPMSAQVFGEKVFEVYEKALDFYHDSSVIDDVQIKDSFVQLYLLRGKQEERLLVTLDDYAEYGLRKNGTVPTEIVNELRQKEEGVRAYQGCLRRISVKDRTRKEMYDWLTTETSCDIRTINRIIEKLEKKGYIDDERYCEETVASLRLALQGPEKITQMLKKKGIPVEMIENKLAELPDTTEEDALTYAEKQLSSMKSDSMRKQKYNLKTKLIQRGYSADTADKVLAKLDFTGPDSREIDNLKRCAAKAKQRYEKKYSGSALRNHVFRYCAAQGYEIDDIYVVMDEMEWNDD